MSSPPLRAPGPIRVLSILLIVGALLVRVFSPHLFERTAPAASRAPVTAPAAAPVPPRLSTTVETGIGFRSPERLEEHFEKHGREFRALSAGEYLGLAQQLRDRPSGGDVLELVRGDGVTCRYDRSTGAFLAFNRDRTIRTFFRPNNGEDYFRRQASRPGDAP